MSQLDDIAELVDLIDRCLDRSDWDRLRSLHVPAPRQQLEADPDAIRAVLEAVGETQLRLQGRMDEISAELEAVPAVRKAARAYMRS